MRGEGVVVAWLTVSPEIEAERFLSGTHRPWYGDDPEEFLGRQAREREPEFRSLDPIVVSTDVASAEKVADAILAGIRERGIELPCRPPPRGRRKDEAGAPGHRLQSVPVDIDHRHPAPRRWSCPRPGTSLWGARAPVRLRAP
jgi:hypothetical protein